LDKMKHEEWKEKAWRGVRNKNQNRLDIVLILLVKTNPTSEHVAPLPIRMSAPSSSPHFNVFARKLNQLSLAHSGIDTYITLDVLLYTYTVPSVEIIYDRRRVPRYP
jgi:hypothetical protein